MVESSARYDEIGRGYATTRRPDPRIAAAILAVLGDTVSVVNVGAGAGSYEPLDRPVIAVEPSRTMLAQRPPGSAPAIQAVAERLPFAEATFDAALAILTVHHWRDPEQGLRELLRVARQRVVVLTWDPAFAQAFWLARDYLPEIFALDVPGFRPVPRIVAALGGALVQPVPIPHDCTDGFLGAYWRQPEAYLQPHIRAGISTFARLGKAVLRPGLQRLADDLRSGTWDRANGHLRDVEALDLGYRLIVHSKPGGKECHGVSVRRCRYAATSASENKSAGDGLVRSRRTKSSGRRGFSRPATEAVLRYTLPDAFGDLTWPLLAQRCGFRVGVLAVDGLDWETPDHIIQEGIAAAEWPLDGWRSG